MQAMAGSPDKYESKYEPKYEPDEHTRIVVVDERPPLREGSRYPPSGRCEPERFDGPSTSRDTRYNGNDYHPSLDYDRPTTSYDQRDSSRSERQGDDLRSQLEYRRVSPVMLVERGRPQDRGDDHRGGPSSDLRARLVEKRTDRRDERPYIERPMERERRPPSMERQRPSSVDRHHPSEFSGHIRHLSDSRHERGKDSRRIHGSPEMQRLHSGADVRRREFDSRRPAEEFESRRPHPESEMRRPQGEPSSRRPREFEGRGSRPETSSRRRRASSDSRPPREMEGKRRRSREGPSPQRYRGDPEDYSDRPRDWESDLERVPRGDMYFEREGRDDDAPHVSERGRGRGMLRMSRGGGYRGRGQRGGPPMRGGSIRGIRPPPFRAPMYPRGFPPARGLHRGYPLRGFFLPPGLRARLPFLPMPPFAILRA